jgi:hypothetical protein
LETVDFRHYSVFKRLIWFFSQATYQTQFLLLVYFSLRLLTNNEYNDLFMIIAPACLSVNVNWYFMVYSRQSSNIIDLHEQRYTTVISHIIDTVFIIAEFTTINNLQIKHVFYYLFYVIFGIIYTYFNYYIRNVWTYMYANLLTLNGWLIFIIIPSLVTQVFSLLFYLSSKIITNYKHKSLTKQK